LECTRRLTRATLARVGREAYTTNMLTPRTLAAICLLPSCLAAQTAAPDAVTEWVRGAAISLTTPVAGHGFEDMQPLKKVVGDARIVSLGEATHGTREFFQLKHRMLEFLATEMGFTIFSIEASMPEAYRLNDFVLEGKGDPAQLIKGMYFWTWNTQEVLDMVLWMREFNKSGKGRVEFTGFDMQTPTVANQIVRDFVAKADPEYVETLARASQLALNASRATQRSAFGTASGMFPVEVAVGKRIRFSGYIKTENVSSYAGFWWRADVNNQSAAFANLGAAAPKGTTDWNRYELEIAIPANATAIYFGPLLAGDGTAWFDDLQVEIDGKPYTGGDYDFTFEASTLKGLSPSGPTYPSRLDDVAHSGKQSLRISHIATPPDPNAVDPKIAAAEWQKVVEHLEASREAYRKKELSTRDVEWAIQNARVVLQGMQMFGNQVTRDTSMAANVKWILDQSPEAKIVLWAHNGHVMTSGGGSMGAALRRIYGDKMVVFGFAFNQGGFQAVSDKHGLKDFTVPPAPAGSLDATLAASGIPLFALDLRTAPKTGPVADWLGAGHNTRSIGALYPEDSPYAYMARQVAPETFNVLLFVEKTTAARKNVATGAPPAR
jgi:erythromycin esterase-like protein